MWSIKPYDEYEKRVRKWPRKHRRELLAVHDNLDTYKKLLDSGTPVEQAKFGFIHTESSGSLAIDQKGAGPATRETRLYFYPEKPTRTIHLFTLGDKDTQKEDNDYCKACVKALTTPNVQERRLATQPTT